MLKHDGFWSSVVAWVTSSCYAVFNTKVLTLTLICTCLLNLLHKTLPIWTSYLPYTDVRRQQHHQQLWNARTKKTICCLSLHLVLITFAAGYQLCAVVASRGFRPGAHAEEGYWLLLQGARLVTASYLGEILFVDRMRLPMLLHHLIGILVIAQLPVKGLDPTGLALPYQQIACFWLSQATLDHPSYLGFLGRLLGWDESFCSRVLIIGANFAAVSKTVSNLGVLFTWCTRIQSHASTSLTCGFYLCAGSLAIKQYFTIRTLRRMAQNSGVPAIVVDNTEMDVGKGRRQAGDTNKSVTRPRQASIDKLLAVTADAIGDMWEDITIDTSLVTAEGSEATPSKVHQHLVSTNVAARSL